MLRLWIEIAFLSPKIEWMKSMRDVYQKFMTTAQDFTGNDK